MKKKFKRFSCFFLGALFISSVNCLAATDIYTVRPGDTLWKIAQMYKVGLSEIVNANPQFEDPNLIMIGDKVTVPLTDPSTLTLEEQVVDLVNLERKKNNIPPLKLNWQLQRVARIKSEEMRDKKYFSHTSPTYGSPFDMLKKFNIPYRSAGENIAKGQKTAEAVMRSWMNSEGHRKNILNRNYTEIGVGYANGKGIPYWTQIFLTP